MKGFIQITTKSGRKLININRIEEICEKEGGGCTIYIASDAPYEQVRHTVDMPFDELLDLIEKGGE